MSRNRLLWRMAKLIVTDGNRVTHIQYRFFVDVVAGGASHTEHGVHQRRRH